MPKLIFDFADPSAVQAWHAIDDRVMGGLSRSGLRHDVQGHAVFEGEVSLERNGGFASVRSTPADRGQPDAAACLIEVRGPTSVPTSNNSNGNSSGSVSSRGDSRHFKLSLLTDNGFDSLNYQARFSPTGGDWQTLRLPLAAFRPSFRGSEVQGAPGLDPARVRQVGLMVADRQAGPFALDIRRISLV